MQPQSDTRARRFDLKVLLWALLALYTYMLPDAIVVYRAIVDAFGKDAAGKVPLVMVVIVGAAYGLAVIVLQRSLKNLLWLVPSGVIAFLILRLVDNPNKHIHIPEYVLMAWLLFGVLSQDHKGKGIFILILFYATLLGVVDELEQGINPARFYGLSDMIVNSASSLIGVFTIMGLKKVIATDWAWTTHLKEFKALVGLGLFGFAGAVIAGAYLFQVQASGSFWGVYPDWLFAWNLLYLALALAMAAYWVLLQIRDRTAEGKGVLADSEEVMTARLWIIPLLVILFYMHALATYVAISGVKFS